VTESPVPHRVKKPSWLDLRLVLGCTLVLGSVVLGAHVVASADRTAPVVALAVSVEPGTVLTAGELRVTRVRLPASNTAAYVGDVGAAVGRQVSWPLARGELLPRAVLAQVGASTTVTIPLAAGDSPTLNAGQRIAVWLSTKSCPAVVVLSDVVVQEVHKSAGGSFSSTGEQDVVVRVSPDLAQRVVSALAQDDAVLRAGVVAGTESEPSSLPPLTCAPRGGGS
jgi:hypothetical protein